VVSTVAGSGVQGFSGDGGSALSASLGRPTSVIMDSGGNIFFSDADTKCVRKIDLSGIITTVAGQGGMGGFSGDGGPATSATFSEPDGVAFNVKGELFILDGSDNVLRKVDT